MSTNIVNISLINSEIFGMICLFSPYRSKSYNFNIVIFAVTGSNLTKFLHNREKLLPFNLLKSELRYRNQFPNSDE